MSFRRRWGMSAGHLRTQTLAALLGQVRERMLVKRVVPAMRVLQRCCVSFGGLPVRPLCWMSTAWSCCLSGASCAIVIGAVGAHGATGVVWVQDRLELTAVAWHPPTQRSP